MKKIAFGLGIIGLTALLTGCFGAPEPLSDKAAEKAVENILENASGGKVDIDIEDDDGTVSIKTNEGEASFGGGSRRSDSVPADLPNSDRAKDFSWFGSAGMGIFAYVVDGADYQAVCNEQIELLLKAGWKKSDSFSMDVEEVMQRTMEKDDANLSLMCALNDDEGKKTVTVSMTKATKN